MKIQPIAQTLLLCSLLAISSAGCAKKLERLLDQARDLPRRTTNLTTSDVNQTTLTPDDQGQLRVPSRIRGLRQQNTTSGNNTTGNNSPDLSNLYTSLSDILSSGVDAPIAIGDFNYDGELEYVLGAARGDGPLVRIFNEGRFGLRISDLAYSALCYGGVYVATGNVDDDPEDELITGAGPGGGPHVKIFDVDMEAGTITEKPESFFPFVDDLGNQFGGGVSVATIRFDPADSYDSIVVGALAGGGPHVKIIDPKTGAVRFETMAYDDKFTGGVFVAAGYFGNDGYEGRESLVTGAGPGGGPHVKIIDTSTGDLLRSFFPYNVDFRGGVRVATANVNNTLGDDLITGAGIRGEPTVKVFAEAYPLVFLERFVAPENPESRNGVHVAGYNQAGTTNTIAYSLAVSLELDTPLLRRLGEENTSNGCPESRPFAYGDRCLNAEECKRGAPRVGLDNHEVREGVCGIDATDSKRIEEIAVSCTNQGGVILATSETTLQCIPAEGCLNNPPVAGGEWMIVPITLQYYGNRCVNLAY